MGLLPEVHRRQLYEKKGFSSIFEFAKKLAGLSEEQVRTVLNLEKKFENKLMLRELLIKGEVSVNKLVRVQAVATKENEEFWVSQVKILPNRALETLVRDDRMRNEKENSAEEIQEFENKNGLQKGIFEDKSLHVQTDKSVISRMVISNDGLQLSDEVKQKLFELQQKEININELILEMLQKRELEIAQEKEQLAEEVQAKAGNYNPTQVRKTTQRQISAHVSKQTPSRYIPIKIKKLLQKEYGSKCSITTCYKPAETIHHTQRFSLSHTHDPHYLAPLCKNHHIIAHSIDLKFQQKSVPGR